MKQMSGLFSWDYLAAHYSNMKCCQNVNFDEIDTDPWTGKNDEFWLLWGIFLDYVKQKITTAVLRKNNSHPVDICKLIKNSIMPKKI